MIRNRLDLHGMRYEDAKRAIIRFLEANWSHPAELELVTGNSIGMKMLVIEILKEYKLDYRIGDLFGENMGYIVTWT